MFTVKFKTDPDLSGLTGKMGNAYRAAAKDALAQTGGHVRKMVRKYIETGGAGWRGLSSMTSEIRGRALSPLYNLGKLIRFKVGTTAGKLRVQIGFFPTRKLGKKERRGFFGALMTGQKYKIVGGKKAKEINAKFKESMGLTQEQLAKKHEFGQRVKVTAAMRKALAAMGHPLKKTTTTLPVPARPMISTVYRKNAASIEKYYAEKFSSKLKMAVLKSLGRGGR